MIERFGKHSEISLFVESVFAFNRIWNIPRK